MIDCEMKEASQKYIQFIGPKPGIESPEADNLESITEDSIVNSNKNEEDEEEEKEKDDQKEAESEEDDEDEKQMSAKSSMKDCIACSNGDLPSGAHKCMKCEKNVHIFPECSTGVGDSEGYGEKRICKACSTSRKRQVVTPEVSAEKKLKSQEAKEMNYKEKWG